MKQRLESYHFFGSEEGLPFEKMAQLFSRDGTKSDYLQSGILHGTQKKRDVFSGTFRWKSESGI